MRAFISRHALLVFFLLVLTLEWLLSGALVPVAPAAVGLIALLPAPVAFLVAALAEGREGVRRLWRKSIAWRSYSRWYLPAVLIPLAVSLVAAGLAIVLGHRPAPTAALFLAYVPLTFILAAGEEVGWQGFAMPHLRKQLAPLPAALLFGVLHALFHLPMYLLPLPEELRQASPFPLFALLAVAFSIYRVWFFERTDGNVPVAILYHTAINSGAILLAGVEPATLGWLMPAVWGTAALALVAAGGLRQPAAGWKSAHVMREP